MEECHQKVWNIFSQFSVGKPCSSKYFPEVDARLSLKLTTKGLLKGKNLWKFGFSSCFSKAKTKEWDKKVWNDFDQFGDSKPSSTTYFLQVGARLLLKLPTKGFLRGKEILKIELRSCFYKAKLEECHQKVWRWYILFNYMFSGSRCMRFIETSHQTVSRS